MIHAMNRDSEWFVLLIGGPSGIGKTTIAAQVAWQLGVSWLMVDDLRLALERSGLPVPDSTRVETFDGPGGLVSVGEAVAPAIEVVIENHVDQRLPVVIEGDGILPSLFERASVRARVTAIRTVYLHEPDEGALHANLVARGRDHWRDDLYAYARRSVRYGAWLKAEAEHRGLPVISVRPWDTLIGRILAATNISAGNHSLGGSPYPAGVRIET
jgi:2-phosphoglycerate kinase